ncbi:MAG TPA: 30S ribosomal protein S18 [Terracidiphilus sp.]|nr:30S ribosomal protein S18 [Terracidiphilus sp.]
MADETQAKAPEAGAASQSGPESSGPGPSSGSGSGPGSGSGSGSGPGSGSGSGPGSGPRPGGRPQGGRPQGGPGGRGKFFRRKKVCKFCTEKIDAIPYRDVRLLQGFVAERGKIVPRRLTGVCTTHQRRLTRAIKQARNIALLPFATRH